MKRHISTSFFEDLHELDQMVISLNGLAQSQLREIVAVMGKIDQDVINTLIANDTKLDEIDTEIFNKAIEIIALRSPHAADLRKVVVSPNIASNLERIGDYAKNIGKRLNLISDAKGKVLYVNDVVGIADLALEMMVSVDDAYLRSDADLAVTVWNSDVKLDKAYNEYIAKIIKAIDAGDCDATTGSNCLFIAKSLERIGDHCTGIAEQIHFRINAAMLDDNRPRIADVGI